ncbi:hypothetical protein PS673_05793 [Pseudomonas fluorescens]|uniref:Uncharacterized protein n=1 Tax=Pseudomonas fluorescens TaxID=294 RepID=A0A5E6Y0B9_PSEFL|nr:hypothetical protein PS673_03147 [Pseudomonas fluorescens]VVN46517.1 hypothetical protein PS673_05793 [Pseudomonas fluorescens]
MFDLDVGQGGKQANEFFAVGGKDFVFGGPVSAGHTAVLVGQPVVVAADGDASITGSLQVQKGVFCQHDFAVAPAYLCKHFFRQFFGDQH